MRLQITFRGIHLSNRAVNFSVQRIRFARVGGGSTVNRPYVAACGGTQQAPCESERARQSLSSGRQTQGPPSSSKALLALQTVPSTSDTVVGEDSAR
jgi:hypothetical protein